MVVPTSRGACPAKQELEFIAIMVEDDATVTVRDTPLMMMGRGSLEERLSGMSRALRPTWRQESTATMT